MADIMDTLLDLVKELEDRERVSVDDVIKALLAATDELETARLDLKAALDLIDDVFTHGDSARWADRAGDFLQGVKRDRLFP
jgi:hypothetical protein